MFLPVSEANEVPISSHMGHLVDIQQGENL